MIPTPSAVLVWTVATYLIASLPFSVWIGRLVFGVNIRNYGDGNPGATNVYRASGSRFWYIVAILLDGHKGLLPVGIAYWILGWRGIEIVPLAWAAIMGHAFSIFLNFQGGKAVAITGGVWIGLTLLEMPIVMSVLLVYWYRSVKESNWAVILWLLSVGLYLLLAHPTNTAYLLVWLGNFLIVLYRHRDGLNHLPTIKRWLPLLPKNGQTG